MILGIEVTGLDRMEHDTRVLVRNLSAPIRPAASQLEEETYIEVRAQYASAGAKGRHGAWPKNKPETVDRYAAMNKRGFKVLNQPMRRTDALFISETTRGGPHSIRVVEDDALTLGTDLAYGALHQKKGRMQYDPTDEGIRRRLSIIKRGVVKEVNQFFDYVETGEFAF